MRRRVSSPAALSAALRASNFRWAEALMGNIPSHKDIFIPLNWARSRGPNSRIDLSGKVPTGRTRMTVKSAGNDESHIRPGEVQVPLPANTDAALYFIGRIRTPWKARKDCPKNARASRESGVVCTIEVDPRWAPGAARGRHLLASDRALLDGPGAARSRGPGAASNTATASRTFSLRSPVRPNPIALAVVELRKVEGNYPAVVGRRLPRRHAAARYQAVLRLDRRHPRRPRRLARGRQRKKRRGRAQRDREPASPSKGPPCRANLWVACSHSRRPRWQIRWPTERRPSRSRRRVTFSVSANRNRTIAYVGCWPGRVRG